MFMVMNGRLNPIALFPLKLISLKIVFYIIKNIIMTQYLNILTQKTNLILFLCIFSIPITLDAQSHKEIKYVEELKQETRKQLTRIMNNYDLDDWIFTDEVKIVHGEDARSYPILQMNTNHLEDDKMQLSVFVHENAHIFVATDNTDESENKVIRELRSLYPNPPAPQQKNLYHHIMVVWIEYDALIELFDKEEASEIIERKIDYYTQENPDSLLSQNYIWYNQIVMDNPKVIGKIMDEFGFNINPKEGILIQ